MISNKYFINAQNLTQRAIKRDIAAFYGLRNYPVVCCQEGESIYSFFHPCSGLVVVKIGGVRLLVIRSMLWGLLHGRTCETCGTPDRVGYENWGIGIPLVDNLQGIDLNKVLNLFSYYWTEKFAIFPETEEANVRNYLFRSYREIFYKEQNGLTDWQRAISVHVEVIDELTRYSRKLGFNKEEYEFLLALKSLFAVKPPELVTEDKNNPLECDVFDWEFDCKDSTLCSSEVEKVHRVHRVLRGSISKELHKLVESKSSPCCNSVRLLKTSELLNYPKRTVGRYRFVDPKDQDKVLSTIYVLPEANERGYNSKEIVDWDKL